MKRFLKQLSFLLTVVGFIVYSGGIVLAAPITVALVDGDWVNGVPSDKVVIANSGISGGRSTARWGASGYDFTSRSTSIFTYRAEFQP